MGTMTAQILVGSSHPNHDGIQPTHWLFLSENSKSAWVLTSQNIFEEDITTNQIIWIPSIDNMLEDAFLMIAIHIEQNPEVIDLAKSFSKNIGAERLELYEEFKDSQRQQLYEKCRQMSQFPKVIISVFQSSTIQMQLKIIEQYQMDVEVCYPIYSRLYSIWTQQQQLQGNLKA